MLVYYSILTIEINILIPFPKLQNFYFVGLKKDKKFSILLQ